MQLLQPRAPGLVKLRQRARLTTDAYTAIRAHAPAWLQRAMDLSLLTLLRREDVASLRFADVRDGACSSSTLT